MVVWLRLAHKSAHLFLCISSFREGVAEARLLWTGVVVFTLSCVCMANILCLCLLVFAQDDLAEAGHAHFVLISVVLRRCSLLLFLPNSVPYWNGRSIGSVLRAVREWLPQVRIRACLQEEESKEAAAEKRNVA